MWGKILGALFGLALLKLPGLLIGLVLGHWFDVAFRQQFEQRGGFSGLFTSQPDAPGLFSYTTFATMGHLAKANGVVTQAHISQATHFMQQLGLTAQQQKEAQSAFREGKAVNFPLQQQIQQFYRVYRGRKDVLQLFLEIQVSTACTAGKIASDVYQLLQQITSYLGFNRLQLDVLIQAYQAQRRFSGRGPERDAASNRNALADAYNVLGIDAAVSDTALKKAYRKLMSQHHPDKLMAQGVPAEMLDVAKRRTQDIQAAYELIRQHRTAAGSKSH